MDHDQNFKRLVTKEFYDFLRLFLPAIARGIDPTSIDFILTTDFTGQIGGGHRVADIAARARLLDASEALIILHTEVESEPDANFPFRMWEYNALFTLEHRMPVISIALLPFTVGKGIELVRYTDTVLGQEYTRLEYWRVPLRGLDAGEYLAAELPLAIPLAALMRPAFGDDVSLKAAIFVRMHRENLPPGTLAVYLDFVQTYLPLTPDKQAEFLHRTTPEGDITMETLEKTWFEQQVEAGIEQHAPWADKLIQQGVLQAKRESLVRLARIRFGEAPADIEELLARLDEAALDRLLERVVTVGTRDEFLAGLR